MTRWAISGCLIGWILKNPYRCVQKTYLASAFGKTSSGIIPMQRFYSENGRLITTLTIWFVNLAEYSNGGVQFRFCPKQASTNCDSACPLRNRSSLTGSQWPLGSLIWTKSSSWVLTILTISLGNFHEMRNKSLPFSSLKTIGPLTG